MADDADINGNSPTNSLPFCVLDRPFVVWSNDVGRDCVDFLTRIDVGFYTRTVGMLLANLPDEQIGQSEQAVDATEERERKDVSSLARMLWHHGIETLVMILGAYIQTPQAPHAYFLKCRTEDAVALARALLQGRRLTYNRSNDAPFTISNLLNGVHQHVPWTDKAVTISKLTKSLRTMLSAFTGEEHRSEYNSIKHGLRAGHGRFALAFGIEEVPGVPAPPEAMRVIGSSRDASFFDVARPLLGQSGEKSKVNLALDHIVVAWSLERVLCDLQLLSLLIGNTVSALKIANGAAPNTVRFSRPMEADGWWERYDSFSGGDVPTMSSRLVFDLGDDQPTADDVIESYRNGPWRW